MHPSIRGVGVRKHTSAHLLVSLLTCVVGAMGSPESVQTTETGINLQYCGQSERRSETEGRVPVGGRVGCRTRLVAGRWPRTLALVAGVRSRVGPAGFVLEQGSKYKHSSSHPPCPRRPS